MIYDASRLPLPLRLSADLVVIGSGAGGMPVATLCAEAGLSVVVLEAGGFVPPDAMNQREERMLPELLLDSGGQVTVDKAVRIHQGRAVGGSTVHNINLCKRIPDQILREWQRTRGLEHLPLQRWAALYDEVEQTIQVSAVPRARWNRHNRILEAGCNALGWPGGGLSHNRTGCIGSGFCELGCAYDAKNNACKVFLPRLVAAGGQVLSRVRATRVLTEGGRAVGVDAVAVDPVDGHPLGSVSLTAPRVCVSASATDTPALLLRSGLPDPGGETGQHLRVHPALIAAGIFEEPVRAWQGIPQTYECTELLDFSAAAGGGDKPGSRIWIVPAFAHPMGTATMLPGYGKAHRESMQRYDHMRHVARPDGGAGQRVR
ncbi:MAG: FAD-binding protein [Oligoflexia bacterium]|nr:FAD-binding protein [Oligoflexia bacterium]